MTPRPRERVNPRPTAGEFVAFTLFLVAAIGALWVGFGLGLE